MAAGEAPHDGLMLVLPLTASVVHRPAMGVTKAPTLAGRSRTVFIRMDGMLVRLKRRSAAQGVQEWWKGWGFIWLGGFSTS